VCAIALQILSIFLAKGKVHDFKMFKDSRILTPKEVKILADLGYLGIDKIHQNSVIPIKGSKKNLY